VVFVTSVYPFKSIPKHVDAIPKATNLTILDILLEKTRTVIFVIFMITATDCSSRTSASVHVARLKLNKKDKIKIENNLLKRSNLVIMFLERFVFLIKHRFLKLFSLPGHFTTLSDKYKVILSCLSL